MKKLFGAAAFLFMLDIRGTNSRRANNVYKQVRPAETRMPDSHHSAFEPPRLTRLEQESELPAKLGGRFRADPDLHECHHPPSYIEWRPDKRFEILKLPSCDGFPAW